MRTYLAGKTRKTERKTRESSEQLVKKALNSFVSVDFGKNMPDSCAAFGCTSWSTKSTTSLQFYRIPSAKRYPEQRITKWANATNDRLRKYITHMCSFCK